MNKWDILAKRCYVSRKFIKRTAYMLGYSGDVDPWVRHIFMQEATKVAPEWAVIAAGRTVWDNGECF